MEALETPNVPYNPLSDSVFFFRPEKNLSAVQQMTSELFDSCIQHSLIPQKLSESNVSKKEFPCNFPTYFFEQMASLRPLQGNSEFIEDQYFEFILSIYRRTPFCLKKEEKSFLFSASTFFIGLFSSSNCLDRRSHFLNLALRGTICLAHDFEAWKSYDLELLFEKALILFPKNEVEDPLTSEGHSAQLGAADFLQRTFPSLYLGLQKKAYSIFLSLPFSPLWLPKVLTRIEHLDLEAVAGDSLLKFPTEDHLKLLESLFFYSSDHLQTFRIPKIFMNDLRVLKIISSANTSNQSQRSKSIDGEVEEKSMVIKTLS